MCLGCFDYFSILAPLGASPYFVSFFYYFSPARVKSWLALHSSSFCPAPESQSEATTAISAARGREEQVEGERAGDGKRHKEEPSDFGMENWSEEKKIWSLFTAPKRASTDAPWRNFYAKSMHREAGYTWDHFSARTEHNFSENFRFLNSPRPLTHDLRH